MSALITRALIAVLSLVGVVLLAEELGNDLHANMNTVNTILQKEGGV